jgi:hypothetical protein
MAEPAVDAWGHCVAVLRDLAAAEGATVAALRRGGRSRTAVLAHARWQALHRREQPRPGREEAEPGGGDSEHRGGEGVIGLDSDVLAVAEGLAATRPPVERALVDLDGRLDRGRLARALGLTPTEATARLTEVSAAWERELDPALLAWLGPGECTELADLLTGAGIGTGEATDVTTLLAVGPDVAAHCERCEMCSDRRRSMASVRALQAQVPVPLPPRAVRVAGTAGRFRLPGSLPPPLGAEAGHDNHRRRVALAAVAVVVAVGAAAGAIAVGRRHDRGRPIAALAAVPGGNALAVAPAVAPANGRVVLTNVSGHGLSWQAVPAAVWVVVAPSNGRLDPGRDVTLVVTVQPDAPPGGRNEVGITASDGSATHVDVIGPPPGGLDVAATLDGCTVRAQVVDDVDATVTLRYREVPPGSPTQAVAMTAGAGGYLGTVAVAGTSVTWWVTASDSRGSTGRTPDQVTFIQDCPPRP